MLLSMDLACPMKISRQLLVCGTCQFATSAQVGGDSPAYLLLHTWQLAAYYWPVVSACLKHVPRYLKIKQPSSSCSCSSQLPVPG